MSVTYAHTHLVHGYVCRAYTARSCMSARCRSMELLRFVCLRVHAYACIQIAHAYACI